MLALIKPLITPSIYQQSLDHSQAIISLKQCNILGNYVLSKLLIGKYVHSTSRLLLTWVHKSAFISHLILIAFVVRFISHSVAVPKKNKKAKPKEFIEMPQLHLWEKRVLHPIWLHKLNTCVNKEQDIMTWKQFQVHWSSWLRIFTPIAWACPM